MADISTYKRCVMPHAFGAVVYHEGDVLPAAHPAVVQSPAYWVALSDAEAAAGDFSVSIGGE